VLLFVIFAFANNKGVGLAALGALPVALLVWAIGMSLGGTTGYAINPARDLGPRIAHFVLPIAGKRDSDWSYSWVPVVGPLIGGASGHEPMHGGFVGLGMLDAACPGAVFTSPVPDQMLAATKAVDGGAGVLHIVKNYTGDVMNFDLAAELAGGEGIEVRSVVIADDVAVQDSLYTAGRRGVGGTVLAEKIVGAAAESGADLATVAALCQKVQDHVR